MLSALKGELKIKIYADDAIKSDAPFCCPVCEKPVTLKKGPIKIAHFAHKPPVTCTYGKGETELHRKAKKEIAAALIAEGVPGVEVEKRLGTVIADVYCELDGHKTAIEVQISKLSMGQIADRTFAYQLLGVAVLWLIPGGAGKYDGEVFSPRQYEKWLHVLNFGRVYYWSSGLKVVAVHFDSHMLHKEATEWGGGYDYASKKFREANIAENELHLCKDFVRKTANARSFGDFSVPKAIFLADRSPVWWG